MSVDSLQLLSASSSDGLIPSGLHVGKRIPMWDVRGVCNCPNYAEEFKATPVSIDSLQVGQNPRLKTKTFVNTELEEWCLRRALVV